ncbi:PTS sugar transporter subunit IIA, partial [Klebsiella pneumoniae]
MTIKELLIEADAIQVGVVESDWQRVIKLAARPLEAKGFISTEYSQAVIDNTLNHGAYYVFDEGIAIPHARPECGVRRNCFREGANKQVISSQADSLIKISRIWAD